MRPVAPRRGAAGLPLPSPLSLLRRRSRLNCPPLWWLRPHRRPFGGLGASALLNSAAKRRSARLWCGGSAPGSAVRRSGPFCGAAPVPPCAPVVVLRRCSWCRPSWAGGPGAAALRAKKAHGGPPRRAPRPARCLRSFPLRWAVWAFSPSPSRPPPPPGEEEARCPKGGAAPPRCEDRPFAGPLAAPPGGLRPPRNGCGCG